jgi:MFS family permease
VYSFDWTGGFRAWLTRVRAFDTWRSVAPNVWFIGITSLLTDISSEMITSILPLYLVVGLGLSPFIFGVVDGLYPGITALVRWLGGVAGDRTRQHKTLAAAGYGLSALSRLAWLPVGPYLPGIMATVTADRIGKGVRTAPRDAMISLSTPPSALGAAFGVHRAMDAAGAMLGPLAAACLLFVAPRRFDLVFVVSFALGVVGLAVLLLFVRNPADRPHTDPPEPVHPSALVPRHRGLWLTLIAGTTLAVLTVSDAFIYLVLQQRGVVAAASIPWLYVGTNATYLLLASPLGTLSDRIPRWRVFILGHMLLAAVYVVLLMPLGVWPTLIIVLASLGGYYAATDGVLSAMASAVLPRTERGSGLGLLATATNVGRLVAAVTFGWAWSTWGTTVALSAFAVLLAAALVAAGVILARAQREIIAG